MGENYLTEQVNNATKRRDRTRQDNETPRLFQRADIIDVVYNGSPADGENFQEGERLLAKASDDGPHIDLIRCNRKVGRIEGDDAGKLHAELRTRERRHGAGSDHERLGAVGRGGCEHHQGVTSIHE